MQSRSRVSEMLTRSFKPQKWRANFRFRCRGVLICFFPFVCGILVGASRFSCSFPLYLLISLVIGFGGSKTSLKLAVSRIKLLKNKREVLVKQMRRDLAQLLETGQEQTARIRVEHVIREQKTMPAYELIEIYCEIIDSRLPIIESQKISQGSLLLKKKTKNQLRPIHIQKQLHVSLQRNTCQLSHLQSGKVRGYPKISLAILLLKKIMKNLLQPIQVQHQFHLKTLQKIHLMFIPAFLITTLAAHFQSLRANVRK